MTSILAHFGHWYVSLLYLAPVTVVVLYLAFQHWQDRRRGDAPDEELE